MMYPNLKAELARRGISLGTLSESLGIHRTTMSLKLSGKSSLTLAEAVRIRDIIDSGLSLEYLYETGR